MCEIPAQAFFLNSLRDVGAWVGKEDTTSEWAGDHGGKKVREVSLEVLKGRVMVKVDIGLGFSAVSFDHINDRHNGFGEVVCDVH